MNPLHAVTFALLALAGCAQPYPHSGAGPAIPGPMHALEHADALALSPQQRA